MATCSNVQCSEYQTTSEGLCSRCWGERLGDLMPQFNALMLSAYVRGFEHGIRDTLNALDELADIKYQIIKVEVN